MTMRNVIADRASAHATTSDPRFLSREQGVAIARRARALAEGGGETLVSLNSWWDGTVRWARNRVHIATDERVLDLSVVRTSRNRRGSTMTNQSDDASIEATVRAAESLMRLEIPGRVDLLPRYRPTYHYATPTVWSDVSAKQTSEERERIVRAMIAVADAQGLQSAGSVEIRVGGAAYSDDNDADLYCPTTRAECSLTVRDVKANASGWAGLSSYDWARIDPAALAERAVQKCVAARNPVAVEPGRWTVVFEPQATYDFVSPMLDGVSAFGAFGRWPSEALPTFPFHRAGTLDDSKLGLRIASEQVTISHDVNDPELGVVPFDGYGAPYTSVTLIDRGILTGLSYDRKYAVEYLHEEETRNFSGAFRMRGSSATIDALIEDTARGLLVTRMSGVYYDDQTFMATGTTRDGVWLIEKGKIVKPVKNFRFVESPLFFLNNIDRVGQAVPVYTNDKPAIVPSVKARDFNMVALADAF